MQVLSYQTLNDLGYNGYLLKEAPERVLQFGEGNFLRAFVDYFIDLSNEKAGFNSKVVLVQPIAPGMAGRINEQEGLYTLYLRGSEDGKKINDKRIISAVSRCINPYEDCAAWLDCAKNPELRYIVSNTTEAGIVYDPASLPEQTPPISFPAKLTRFLMERWHHFGSIPGKGFVILSCELIDNNGAELKKCVHQYIEQWQLPQAFAEWVDKENLFCSTLVDRIVTGYPRNETLALNEENGYVDNLIDTGEVFGMWVIEGPAWLEEELPFKRAGLPIHVVVDHTPYKKRKVRILNGAHTSMVPAAYLCGEEIVRDCMQDDIIRGFMNKTIHEEIIPTLTLDRDDLENFANAVCDRFNNPFVDHALLSIALNSTSKWKARVMPSFLGYVEKYGKLPRCISLSMAALIAFYHCERLEEDCMIGKRGEEEYRILDDRYVLEFYAEHRDDAPEALVQAVLSNTRMWGQDLTQVPGFADAVVADLYAIEKNGMKEVLQSVL